MTTGEVAEEFEVTRQSVWSWINTGKLRAIRTPGGWYKVRRADVEAILNGESASGAPTSAA